MKQNLIKIAVPKEITRLGDSIIVGGVIIVFRVWDFINVGIALHMKSTLQTFSNDHVQTADAPPHDRTVTFEQRHAKMCS